MLTKLFGPLVDRFADRLAANIVEGTTAWLEPRIPNVDEIAAAVLAKMPDLSDLDDQLVAKIPDFGDLATQIVTEITRRIPFLGGRS